MRKFMLAALMMLFPIVGVSQDTTKILVSKNILTRDQMAQVTNTQMTPENVSKWAGAGREVGIAVNGALSAVTEQASKFGETKIGKLTIYLVVWKVVGKDIVRIIAATVIFIIGISMIIWSMRKYVGHKYLTKEVFDAEGKVKERQWDEERSSGEGIASHFGLMAALIIICTFIAFI